MVIEFPCLSRKAHPKLKTPFPDLLPPGGLQGGLLGLECGSGFVPNLTHHGAGSPPRVGLSSESSWRWSGDPVAECQKPEPAIPPCPFPGLSEYQRLWGYGSQQAGGRNEVDIRPIFPLRSGTAISLDGFFLRIKNSWSESDGRSDSRLYGRP